MGARRAGSLSDPNRSAGGFSLIELVSIIAVVGVLAAVAIPRFVGVDTFASRGFSDEAIGVVRYAQKTAIAWRQPIFVCVTATQVAAAAASGCATPISHPATGAPLVATAPAGVTATTVACPTIATISFSFDGQGRPSAAQTINLCSTVPGDPARQIVVEPETGYVHR